MSIIKVENLSKNYLLTHKQEGPYTALRDIIADKFRAAGRRIFHPFAVNRSSCTDSSHEEFWALRDVSFEINQGDRLGIIGRNGAGKSTLLKILSRITEPTRGRVTLRGRVASLLEVGTGFHPELTGRENVYLNGAILGMNKSEIKKKFDEIVAFAEVEKFLDTPVKRYSSGMYVRLAFAVAAHLEPDILIVDEVLAVGDAQFQKKCLGKMEEVSTKEERTVLFVSHNMGAIKSLCKKVIVLENGEKTFEGSADKGLDHYLHRNNGASNFKPFLIRELRMTVKNIELNSGADGIITPLQPLTIDIVIDAEQEVTNIGIQFMISHEDTEGIVFATNTKQTKNIDVIINEGCNKLSCVIDSFNLCSGKYRLGFAVDIPFTKFYYYDLNVLSFDVVEIMPGKSRLASLACYSHVYLKHNWVVN